MYDELGIASVSELFAALHEQRLRTLRGWGPRSEANLAQAIHDAQSAGGRIHLDVALDLARVLAHGPTKASVVTTKGCRSTCGWSTRRCGARL